MILPCVGRPFPRFRSIECLRLRRGFLAICRNLRSPFANKLAKLASLYTTLRFSHWRRYGIQRGAAMAYSVGPLWHTSWRRYGIQRGAPMAYIVAPLWHTSWRRYGMTSWRRHGILCGAVMPYIEAPPRHTSWRRCGIYRGAAMA